MQQPPLLPLLLPINRYELIRGRDRTEALRSRFIFPHTDFLCSFSAAFSSCFSGKEDGISTNGDSGITSEEDNSTLSNGESVDGQIHEPTNDGVGDSEPGEEEGMDVPRNLKSGDPGSIAGGGACSPDQESLKEERRREKREKREDAGEESWDGERDDSSPISNKRGRNADEGCNDDTSSSNSKNNNNSSAKRKTKQRKPNGSAGDEGEKVAEKETKNSFAMIIDEAAGSGSRPGLCSSSPDLRQDRHHVNGRKRSPNSTGEDGEDEESDEDDDDDAAAAPSVFHNNEGRGNSDSSPHRLHSSLRIAFSSSSSAGGGECATAAAASSAPGMDSHHHHAERNDNNSCSSNNSHLMQPSPKKKFKVSSLFRRRKLLSLQSSYSLLIPFPFHSLSLSLIAKIIIIIMIFPLVSSPICHSFLSTFLSCITSS